MAPCVGTFTMTIFIFHQCPGIFQSAILAIKYPNRSMMDPIISQWNPSEFVGILSEMS